MWATGGWSPGFSRLKPGLQLCECPFGIVSKAEAAIMSWKIFTVATFLLWVTAWPLHNGLAADHATVFGLIERIAPRHAADFVIEDIPVDHGRDVFEIESRAGKIVLRGNSPLSIAFGLNWYLKYTAIAAYRSTAPSLELPTPVGRRGDESQADRPGRSPVTFNNYCTFGYSMPWWDWPQWEKFIDWMAMNGINMPLAVTGQEAVWQAVGRRFGMTEAEIDAFLPGPPYLPFCWMGCLDGHGGPLPKNWTAEHAVLEKKILARQRELGMTPVLQGFTGHVPEAILKKRPAPRPGASTGSISAHGCWTRRIRYFRNWPRPSSRNRPGCSAPITFTTPIRSSRWPRRTEI